MADYSEFNNNNYLPGLYNDMATAAFSHFTSAQQFRNPVVSQNSFTFTSPTQCSTLATHRPSIQTTSPINMSAPGVGTSWQHSIPVTMPWVDMVSSRGAGTTTVFTGVPLPAYPDLQMSCTVQIKPPKRKAIDSPDEAPMSKVYLCADQFANMTITTQEQPSLDQVQAGSDDRGVQVFIGARGTQCRGDAEAWQRFRDIENTLDVDLEEDIEVNMAASDNWEPHGPCFKVAQGILENTTHSPILPRKVMEEITKPCMQIVLWKSPGELIRDIKEENQSKSSSTTTTITSTFTNSKLSNFSNINRTERSPLMPRDNIMEADGSNMTVASPDLAPQLQSHYSNDLYTSSPGFLKSLPSTLTSSSTLNELSCSNIQTDFNTFENIDDEMQL
ncbi:unnamed protein product [Lymnaea stagnalis]|uniref:Uncharacterized protein n=1 Tax=Lymnaea stagnalis TaxID=6523 RepID=A0AAV2H4B7_LYMST